MGHTSFTPELSLNFGDAFHMIKSAPLRTVTATCKEAAVLEKRCFSPFSAAGLRAA